MLSFPLLFIKWAHWFLLNHLIPFLDTSMPLYFSSETYMYTFFQFTWSHLISLSSRYLLSTLSNSFSSYLTLIYNSIPKYLICFLVLFNCNYSLLSFCYCYISAWIFSFTVYQQFQWRLLTIKVYTFISKYK